MTFFPTREYVVTERDTIRFELPNLKVTAPHIVTFLNGAPDFPLGTPMPPLANAPFPFSAYPFLPIVVLNPATVFPHDPEIVSVVDVVLFVCF
jgi:hypothetical protein